MAGWRASLRPSWAFSLLALALALGAIFERYALPAESARLLDWQPSRAGAQPWRLWTAAGVHWSAQHLAVNLAGAGLLAALGWAAQLPRRAAWAWCLAWPLTHLGLALQPALLHYGGLSGVLHAGVAVAAWWLLVAAQGQRRVLGGLLLLGLCAKLLLERPWAAVLVPAPELGLAVAPGAHVSGALAGLCCAALFWSSGSWRHRSDVAPRAGALEAGEAEQARLRVDHGQ